MSSAADIIWVDDLTDDSLAKAGSKIARLGELRSCGVRVPDGFVITTDVFVRFLIDTGVGAKVDALVEAISDPDDAFEIEGLATEARKLIANAQLPPGAFEALADAYEELCYRKRDLNIPVAVRSSATGEDAADASFAGQFDTYLGVTGAARLADAVQRCWASVFSTRAVGYRLKKGLSYADSPMAVGVLELVHAKASGVAFSIHPVSGSEHRMVIEGSWGWGEAVVSGAVTPDHIEIGKSDRRVLDYTVANKLVVSAFDYAQGLVVEHEMPRRLREQRILGEEEIDAIVAAVLQIENKYGYAVDVEWVLDRHRREGEPITIVQTRPVTVVEKAAAPKWDPVAYANKYAFAKGKG